MRHDRQHDHVAAGHHQAASADRQASGQRTPANHHAARGHGSAGHGGHANHHEMMARDFRRRFVIAGLVTIPVLALSPTVQGWLGYRLPTQPLLKWLLFLLASVVALWGARPFYQHAWQEIKRRRLGMMVLVSLAVGSGYLYSVATTFLIEGTGFYWEISTLTVFLLFGHWMEMRSVVRAGGALRELVKLIPPMANLIQGDSVREVQTESLAVGDRILVRPGDKVPIDGLVKQGNSHVNEALLTGESKPIAKRVGDQVIGGTVNAEGSLTVEVVKVGRDTALAQIVDLVRQAQASKPPTQQLADRAAHYLTIVAIAVGLGTLLVWHFGLHQPFVFALSLAMSVVVITCPHALGLAIPMVTTVTTSLAAKNGILIQDMAGLETARRATWVLFDKTGTLTEGRFGVTDLVPFGGSSRAELLGLAAGLERQSEHLVARSVVEQAERESVSPLAVTGFRNVAGQGVVGEHDGQRLAAGNRALMANERIDLPKSAVEQAERLERAGRTVVYVAQGGRLAGLIALADLVRRESSAAVKHLQEMGLRLALITGDNESVAASVAEELGLDTYFAAVQPEDKINKVKELQANGEAVIMVGDGVNDAPALTQADVGVAIGAGTDVAVASSEIVLVRSNPSDIVKLIRLSRITRRKMVQNLAWATGYNVLAIPLAAGVLQPVGLVLRPEWGALIMSASSIIVVVNALMMRRIVLNQA